MYKEASNKCDFAYFILSGKVVLAVSNVNTLNEKMSPDLVMDQEMKKIRQIKSFELAVNKLNLDTSVRTYIDDTLRYGVMQKMCNNSLITQ